jgi:hypothetical protein
LSFAAALPARREPPRDLWPEIHARIGEEEIQSAADEAGALAGRTRRGFRARPIWTRSLAAAALLVFAVLGLRTVFHSLRAPESGVRIPANSASAGSDEITATLSALAAECGQGGCELRRIAMMSVEETRTPTLALLAENLKLVDLAIDQARRAWERNPGDSLLAQRVLAAYRSKLFLQETARRVIART